MVGVDGRKVVEGSCCSWDDDVGFGGLLGSDLRLWMGRGISCCGREERRESYLVLSCILHLHHGYSIPHHHHLYHDHHDILHLVQNKFDSLAGVWVRRRRD